MPHRDDLARREFRRILLIKPSSLGDIVHALPLLHGLRSRYPGAQIDWLVATPFAPLIAGHPDLSSVRIFDRKTYGRMLRSGAALIDFARFVDSLRRQRYDLAIDLQGLARSAALAVLCGAPIRMGFRAAREGAPLTYTHHVASASGSAHAVDRNWRFSHALGFGDQPIRFDLRLAAEERTRAARLLDDAVTAKPDRSTSTVQAAKEARRVVGVVPAARWETKVWSEANFAALIDVIHDRTPARCVLLGGREDAAICQRIAAACRCTPGNLAGTTGVREFAAVIAELSAVVCLDSAAAHLAVAFDRPLVCIVGPTNPARTGPYGRLDSVARVPVDCSPCYLRKLSQCRHEHRCMRELTVGVVAEKVIAALNHSVATPSGMPTLVRAGGAVPAGPLPTPLDRN